MSFTSQKYKKYFTLNHNGPKNVRMVQTIAYIGVEMMPAGAEMMPAGVDVGCGWRVRLIAVHTTEQVQQLYGLPSANICHIVRVHHISKVKVGVKKLLLKTDVQRVMAEMAVSLNDFSIVHKLL